MLSSDYDGGPRARWLAEADDALAAEQAIELASGGNGSAVSRAAGLLARHQAAARRSRAAAMQVQGRTCGTPNDLGYCTEMHHDLDCKTIAPTPVMAATFASREDSEQAWEAAAEFRQRGMARAAAPWVDDNGRTWNDQDGQPMSLAAIGDETLGYVTRRGYSPQAPKLRVSQKRHMIHRDWDTAGEEVPADTEVRARMLKEEYDPTPESPAEIAARRALRGGRPTVGRHWGDAYDDAPDWDTMLGGLA